MSEPTEVAGNTTAAQRIQLALKNHGAIKGYRGAKRSEVTMIELDPLDIIEACSSVKQHTDITETQLKAATSIAKMWPGKPVTIMADHAFHIIEQPANG